MLLTRLPCPGFSTKALVQNHEAARKTDISPEVLRFAQDDRFFERLHRFLEGLHSSVILSHIWRRTSRDASNSLVLSRLLNENPRANHEAARKTDISPEVLRFAQDDKFLERLHSDFWRASIALSS